MDRRAFCSAASAALLLPVLGGCAASAEAKLPATRFFVFGEGDRRKLLYRAGTVTDIRSGEVIWQEKVSAERQIASQTAVEVTTRRGPVRIREDEDGVWIGKDRVARGSPIKRPRFAANRNARRLRALHHEILVNIVDGEPVPNLFVYSRPWRRDAAMMAMSLAATGNVALIKPWVARLDRVFDGNAGTDEPDNIGQTLYLLALANESKHPLVGQALDAARRFSQGAHISGSTDGSAHPVYQTLWLKFGLKSLGLPDPYHAPLRLDHYRALAWWAPQASLPYPLRFGGSMRADFPYLAWAEAHYWKLAPPALPDEESFPQTWEANAAQADYKGMKAVGDDWAKARTAGPHGWHAAEAFLYLLQQG